MRDALPPGALWSAFGLGRLQMPMVAQAVLLGGNVRVGLEDNLYLERGVLATNAQLVERARTIVELLGGSCAHRSANARAPGADGRLARFKDRRDLQARRIDHGEQRVPPAGQRQRIFLIRGEAGGLHALLQPLFFRT